MADKPASEKTEKPTPKRLKEARERGQIAKTPDLATWVGMLLTTVLIQSTVQRGAVVLRDLLNQMGVAIAHPETPRAMKYARDAAWKAVGVVAPLLIGMMVIVLVANIAQVGFRPTAKKMKPDFSRLNLFKGLKRMVGAQAWWELGKALAKTAVLAFVALPIIGHAMQTLSSGGGKSMFDVAAITASTALTLARNVAAAGLVIAVADFAVQKRRVLKQLRMTRQELREEMKNQEGNPEMKRALRSRAQSISRNRMIGMVAASDVVVVNPTHYAVALKYDAARGAPQVVAKGAGVLAARIRSEAEAHGVPIVREPVLTRTLYRSCALGQLIPVDLYEAVAQLLAFVFGLRAKGRAEGVHTLRRPALL